MDHCNELRAREEPFVLATVVAYKSPQSAKPGSKAIIKSNGSVIGWVGGGCVQPIGELQPGVNGDGLSAVFIGLVEFP